MNRHRSRVRREDALGDVETEADSLRAGVAPRVATAKRIEDDGEQFARNGGPMVGDLDHDLCFFATIDANANGLERRAVFDGVAQQVRQDLRQSFAVPAARGVAESL